MYYSVCELNFFRMQLFFSDFLSVLEKRTPISLATILDTKGSAPQVTGASAVFGREGLISGTLGGGVMEGDIQEKAMRSLDHQMNSIVDFNLDSTIEDNAGPICGGYATILIDSNPISHIETFRNLTQTLDANEPGVLVTIVDRQDQPKTEIARWWIPSGKISGPQLPDILQTADIDLKSTLDFKKPVLSEINDRKKLLFCQPVYPVAQLVIIGAGHIGKALSHIGKLLDFHVTVIDDRPEHANSRNIPDADVILAHDVEKDIQQLNITDNTYIVIVTQGHEKDAIALRYCIHSGAAYIGMIGSKRKTRLMKEDFIKRGLATKEELDRVFAPIGMEIHAKTVQEITVSIAAQLVKMRHEQDSIELGKEIGIIILAAGKSKRMGQQKLLMNYNGKSIIEHIVLTAMRSHAGDIYVVLGSHWQDISEKIRTLPVKTILNENFEQGMLSSVQCGFNAMEPSPRAGILMLGDQPMVRTGIINKLIDHYYRSSKGIIVPVFQGKKGHPVLIDAKYMPQIGRLDPDVGLRQLMEENMKDIYEMEVETNTILKDIDTIEDYNKELTS